MSTSSERLLRTNRLLHRRDFLRVQQTGKRVHTAHFVIMVLPASHTKLGVTVTRRIAGAVGRNRVKRVVREVFRKNRALFPSDCELVWVARDGAQRLDYGAVQDELLKASAALGRAAVAALHKAAP